jgi:hypothetical protein
MANLYIKGSRPIPLASKEAKKLLSQSGLSLIHHTSTSTSEESQRLASAQLPSPLTIVIIYLTSHRDRSLVLSRERVGSCTVNRVVWRWEIERSRWYTIDWTGIATT